MVMEPLVRADTNDYELRVQLAEVEAWADRRREATRDVELALSGAARDTNKPRSQIYTRGVAARVNVALGRKDAAIDQLEYLLTVPSEIAVPGLRVGHRWDSLRDHPRFRRLVEGRS